MVRADSAFFNADVVAAIRRAGARFSITARHDTAVVAAIAGIDEQAWTPIRYPEAIWDEAERRWVSDAEVAETCYTAFISRPLDRHVTARLIVRRVRRLNTTPGQDELMPGYRYHAVFTNTPLPTVQAEHCHPGHAIVEQVIADLKQGPIAHLPSGSFGANSAWLVCAAMAFNLTRAAGCLASVFHAKATTGTIRTQLITMPAHGSPAPLDGSYCTYPPTGPGNSPGRHCSPRPADHPKQRPDHPAPRGATGETVEKPDRPATPTRPTRADRRDCVRNGVSGPTR